MMNKREMDDVVSAFLVESLENLRACHLTRVPTELEAVVETSPVLT